MWRKQMVHTNAEEAAGVDILEEPRQKNGRITISNAFASGPVIAELHALTATGSPLILLPENRGGLTPSEATIPLNPRDIGCRVLVVFERNDPERPIIIGTLGSQRETVEVGALTAQVTIDGRSLNLRADRELTLTCGDASITLTQAGKVIIRGTAILSRSSGVNRIKGACVQIN